MGNRADRASGVVEATVSSTSTAWQLTDRYAMREHRRIFAVEEIYG
jgi:hypothetical protein